MSSKPRPGGGYNAGAIREPANFTIEEMKEIGNYFKGLFDESNIKWAIYAAGVAGVLESLHLLILAIIYIHQHGLSL